MLSVSPEKLVRGTHTIWFKLIFEREWNSILCGMEKRLVEVLLKEFLETIHLLDLKIHVEIELSDSTDRFLEDLEKRYNEYEEKPGKRRKMK